MTVQGGLTEAHKEDIQAAYRRWLAGRGFRARKGQRQMIALVARQMASADNRVCVVEAGTGTGKTLAYCLGVIPLALATEKRVVVSTATVALQEQVVLQDLPDLKRHGELDFTYALAKGRGRYVCPKRLQEQLAADPNRQMAMFAQPGEEDMELYRRMWEEFDERKWDGELDSWDEPVAPPVWSAVTTDHRGCSKNRCEHFRECPFFRARAKTRDANVVVANHDLVLADLALGGGVVLPEPEETIFILDEAHHLPEKTQQHFAAQARLRASAGWLEQMSAAVATMAQRFARPPEVVAAATRLTGEVEVAGQLLEQAEQLAEGLEFRGRDEREGVCRFPQGRVPEELRDLAEPLATYFDSMAKTLAELHENLEEVMDGDRPWQNADQAGDWLPVLGTLLHRAEASGALFADYAKPPSEQDELTARWATRIAFQGARQGQTDVELASAPIDPGTILHKALWDACHGAVATSATLCALGSFERFIERSGLDAEVEQMCIPSPFDFPNVATFTVPRMAADAGNFDAHTAELTARLPDLLAQESSALVLFTSWRQFRAVVEALPSELLRHCLLQGERSKRRLLERHRKAIDRGGKSYIFGLGSFTEGVDLPGDYCRHVILAKLPFQAPDDPLDEALAEWLESNGRNPFYEMSVPDTSLRLVQACGRLIRSDTDTGRITLLDRRIVTRRYGRSLLDTLPPYRMDFDAP